MTITPHATPSRPCSTRVRRRETRRVWVRRVVGSRWCCHRSLSLAWRSPRRLTFHRRRWRAAGRAQPAAVAGQVRYRARAGQPGHPPRGQSVERNASASMTMTARAARGAPTIAACSSSVSRMAPFATKMTRSVSPGSAATISPAESPARCLPAAIACSGYARWAPNAAPGGRTPAPSRTCVAGLRVASTFLSEPALPASGWVRPVASAATATSGCRATERAFARACLNRS
jgi:hypothetical protein